MHEFRQAEGAVVETAPVTGPATEARLPHLATPAFRFKYHPLRWQFFPADPGDPDSQDEFLPLLGTIQYDLGVSNIDKNGGDTLARVEHDRRGWMVLPWTLVPPGTPNGRYIRAFPARGGVYHCTAWETPRHLGNRILEPRVDQRGYRAFLRWLVAEGHVPAASEDALALSTAAAREVAKTIGAKAVKHPDRAAEAETARETLARMEAAAASALEQAPGSMLEAAPAPERSARPRGARRTPKPAPVVAEAEPGTAAGGEE